MLTQRQRMSPVGPADAARLLGITIKTLKVYERYGLISPQRTPQGWRVYSAGDLERLFQAIGYRAMGFGLSQIGALLDAGREDVVTALVIQEEALRARRIALHDAISAVREARRRMRAATLQLVA
jgi:MerR family transcriptional regulator, thiopeptide resistance regulator